MACRDPEKNKPDRLTDVTNEPDRPTEVTDKSDRPTEDELNRPIEETKEPDRLMEMTNELDRPTEVTNELDRLTEVTNEPTLEKPTPPPLTPHSEAHKLMTALGVTPSQERILQVLLPLTKIGEMGIVLIELQTQNRALQGVFHQAGKECQDPYSRPFQIP